MVVRRNFVFHAATSDTFLKYYIFLHASTFYLQLHDVRVSSVVQFFVNAFEQMGKSKGWVFDIALLTKVRLATRSALKSQKLIGMS